MGLGWKWSLDLLGAASVPPASAAPANTKGAAQGVAPALPRGLLSPGHRAGGSAFHGKPSPCAGHPGAEGKPTQRQMKPRTHSWDHACNNKIMQRKKIYIQKGMCLRVCVDTHSHSQAASTAHTGVCPTAPRTERKETERSGHLCMPPPHLCPRRGAGGVCV